MRTTEANINFPVLGFTPDREIWGFEDLNTLTSCGPRTLKNNMQIGMELIDAEGRRWGVRSIRRTGRDQPLLRWLIVSSHRRARIADRTGAGRARGGVAQGDQGTSLRFGGSDRERLLRR